MAYLKRPRCQVPHCRARVAGVVDIELPDAWEGSAEYRVITVSIGACGKHGRELRRRALAVLEARSDLYNLLSIVQAAVEVEADLRHRAERAECDLLEAEGAVDYQRECAQRAELALRLVEEDGRSVEDARRLAGGTAA